MTQPLMIRPSRDADVADIARIYGHAVAHGTGTFETEPPDENEIARRRSDVIAKGLPWLVAERDGRVLGYAYASPFRPRPAYRFCVEDSVYVDATARGHGVGRLLLAELIARCEAWGARQMLAVIGDSANARSIGMHKACAFEPAGTLGSVGWKFERWLDVVILQRALSAGDAAPPGAN